MFGDKKLLVVADRLVAYESGEPIVSREVYDLLRDSVLPYLPSDHPYLDTIGHAPMTSWLRAESVFDKGSSNMSLDDFYCVIYMTICLVNNKIYVGQHRDNKRNYMGSGKLLTYAFNKHGRENFYMINLEYCRKEVADDREIYWIAKLGSTDRARGYNIYAGGRGTPGHNTDYTGANNPNYGNGDKIRGDKNPAKRPEVRKKISENTKGKKRSAESRRNISLSHKGLNKGKKRSVECIRKWAAAVTGKPHGGLYNYTATSPDGFVYGPIRSLEIFCKNNNLKGNSVRGSIQHGCKYKGWKFTRTRR